jgi:OmcA/MtrC family decaheme c-type cytochrome
MDRKVSLAALAGLAFVLIGCGDEGPAGPPGPPGPPGVVLTGDPSEVLLTIDAVTVTSGRPVVEFKVTDGDGIAYAGVESSALRFTFAKLVPGTNGDPSAWQSYINRLEQPDVGPGLIASVQANSDSGGTFVNHGDGTYTYTFGADVTAVTTPLAVAYVDTLTHRLGMSVSIGDGIEAVNGAYDFVPATGATTGIASRDIVATASCNECHGQLEAHGGSRVETQFCVTCHNPGTTDANSTNTLDMKVMVHKIHMGEDLPSGSYFLYGRNDELADFSLLVYPQDQHNCVKCHDGNDATTPQGNNWATVPSLQACGACHDDVDFAAGIAGGHDGGTVTNNADCLTCHAAGRVAGSIEESHADWILAEAQKYRFNVVSVTNTAPGQMPRVTYSITNPITGAAYALTDPAIANGSLSARFSFSNADYHNTGLGTATSAPGSSISLNLLTGATDNGDGTYSSSFTAAIPAAATGSGTMALEGRVAVDVQGPTWHDPLDGTRDRIPVQSQVGYFAITDAAAVPRRQVTDTAKCQMCHGVLEGLVLHGGSRTDNNYDCVTCHNPDNTDITQRPVDPDGTKNGVNTAALDGLEERPIDFRVLIHSIHGATKRVNPFVVYGFGGTAYDFSMAEFPGRPQRCETCHFEDTYYPMEDTTGRLGVTVSSGSTVIQRSPSLVLTPAGANLDHADDQNISFAAAACGACHDSSLTKNHMELNGALFTALQTTLSTSTPETCAICHGPGRSADVKVVHGFD